MKSYLLVISLFLCISINAQVGINTITPKASLDIEASNSVSPNRDDGILIPRIDNFSILEPGPGQDGMLVFASGNGIPLKGFYYWDISTSTWIPLNRERHYIGELYGGGIVSYVYDDGQHGLIASLDDLNSGVGVPWGLYATDVNNCESDFDGVTNTFAIIGAGGQPADAAGLCDNLSDGGFTDWYLPSIFELRALKGSILAINVVLTNDNDPTTNPLNIDDGTGWYWSSTEISRYSARNYNFSRFNTNTGIKNQNYRVRAVRAF